MEKEQAIHNAFFALDQEEHFIFISQEAAALLSGDATHLMGKNIWTAFPALRKTDFFLKCKEAVASHQAVCFESFEEVFQGWYTIHIAPTATGTEIFFQDITFLKTTYASEKFPDEAFAILASSLQSEHMLLKLKKSETLLYNLIMETPAMICLLKGPDHVFELVSPFYKQFFGGIDFTGISIRKEAKAPQAQAFLWLLDQVYETGKPYVGKEHFGKFDRTGTGVLEDGYFNFVYQPTHDGQGKVDGILVFGYEVTEQVLARKIMEAGADRLRIVLEAIPQMAWTARPDGKVDFYNQRWYDFVGFPAVDPEKELWEMVIHPDDLEVTSKKWKKSVETGKSFEIENRFRRASDGVYCWHISRALPVVDKDGNIIFWVGSCTDIHGQKTAIENLHEARTQLNAINQELSKKNQELERINNDLDNFVYAASHDLKAPVSNIEGLTNLLLECVQEENIQNKKIFTSLSMIDFSIKRFKTTIQDLADIAKINKNLSDDIEEIDLNEVIEEVTILISDMVHKSGAKIVVRTGAWHIIHFSYANLKSLVYNLLSNAVKYRHPERAPEIVIETFCENGQLILCVRDNGLGIDPQHQEKIFTMFKRLHNHMEGNGLGLFLVKRIVENAGGRILVESELGKGSIFKVYLNKHVK